MHHIVQMSIDKWLGVNAADRFLSMTAGSATLGLLAVWALSLPVLATEGERYRTRWHGSYIEYIERDGMAIAEGDLILGSIERIRNSTAGPDAARSDSKPMALVDPYARLWPRSSSGVVEIPYVFEAGPQQNVERAVVIFNETFNGLIRWLPRSGQTDYVAFRLQGDPGGACSSYVGRIGGRQDIAGDPLCSTGRLLHEMGHVLGLLHTQNDPEAGKFVDIFFDRISPAFLYASQPIESGRRYGGYDYRSIMHYTRQHFRMLADPLTMETKPAGIDMGLRENYSPGDIDAIQRLYGTAPTLVTVTTNPPGLRLRIDGQETSTPAQFSWAIGSQHQLDILPGLQTLDGFSFSFGRWSHDSSSSPATAINWLVVAGNGVVGQPPTVPETTVLTANFIRLIAVDKVLPASGGQVTVTADSPPWPGTSNLYRNFTKFTIDAQSQGTRQPVWELPTAVAISGGAGGAPSASVRISEAIASVRMGASFVDAPGLWLKTDGPGMNGNVAGRLTRPDGIEIAIPLPFVQPATSGNYRLKIDSPQMLGTDVRYVLDGIDGLDDSATGQVAAPQAAQFRPVTVRMRKQLRTVTESNPGCLGGLQLSDPGPWHTFGQPLTATATPGPGVVFAGWSGTVSGSNPVINVNVGDAVPDIIANFNIIAEPLALTAIASASVSRVGPWTFDILATGMGAGTRLVVGNGDFAVQLIDSRHARVTLSASDFSATGKTLAYLYNPLGGNCRVSSEYLSLAAPAPNYTDMWWAGSQENGWGASITEHSDIQFIVIYAYDAASKPVWYVLPSGGWNADRTAYSGSLYLPTSAPFDAYNPDKFKANASVGSATVRYDTATTALLSYTINGVSGSKNIQRQLFGKNDDPPALVVGDLWWGGASQDGWGVNIAQHGNTLFPVWYTYNANGTAVWYVVPGGVWSGSTFTGDMYSTTGSPWLGKPYNPASLVVTNVGKMVLSFETANKATMTYTVNGVTQSKSIVRQPF